MAGKNDGGSHSDVKLQFLSKNSDLKKSRLLAQKVSKLSEFALMYPKITCDVPILWKTSKFA